MNISCDDECLFFLKKALSEQMFFLTGCAKQPFITNLYEYLQDACFDSKGHQTQT
jgi:hypothetical protein